MRFAVMIEGQEDVSWDDWVAIARTSERLGFEALMRSDHYGSVDGVEARGALDAWGTLCGLAAVTSTLRLGTLVSPATFRHPSVLAKNAVTADHISGGRIEVGLGTGWHDREHAAFGFPFPPMGERMDRLAEQLEIVTRSWSDGVFSFDGEHWSVERLDARPKPVQRPLPLLMGGAGKPRARRWPPATPPSTTSSTSGPTRPPRAASAWSPRAATPAAIRKRSGSRSCRGS